MAQAGDFFRTRYMVEVAGVTTMQKQDWELVSVDGADDLGTILLDLAQAWFDTVKSVITTECLFSCMAYYNWSRPEQAVVYPTLPGLNAGSSHPQFAVVRCNIYGQDAASLTAPIHRGASNLSGVAESYSTRGRLNDPADFTAWRAFQVQTLQTAATGWTVNPMQRYVSVPGPTPTYAFDRVLQAEVNPRIFCLRGRKTKLCA